MESSAPTSQQLPINSVVVAEEIVHGTVTITPLESQPPFMLSGHGDHWSTTAEDLILQLPSPTQTTPTPPTSIRYNIIFTLSSSNHTFDSPALEITQIGQNAFICPPAQSEGGTIAVSFLNAVTAPVTYSLGFRIKPLGGTTINWDPAVAFNPPE